jgi:hypothetical protein
MTFSSFIKIGGTIERLIKKQTAIFYVIFVGE